MDIKQAGKALWTVVEQIIGPMVGRRSLAMLVGYVENAGSPVSSLTPAFIGQLCFDTTNSVWYRATGLANTDWANDVPAGVTASAAEINKLTGVTAGTASASKAAVLGTSKNLDVLGLPVGGLKIGAAGAEVVVASSAAELNTLAAANAVLATEAAAGITGGTGTVYKSEVQSLGGIIKTSIFIDLTGLGTSTTDGDIIGQGASAAHIGRITAARNGTIAAGLMTCLETPATGADDIDLYSATEATGKFDDAISGLTETQLVSKGGAWAAGDIKQIDTIAANQYLYLTNGEAGTVGTFTAGKFLIELYGY